MSVMTINSLQAFNDFREQCRKSAGYDFSSVKECIMVCQGGGCIASGSIKVKAAFEESIKKQGLSNQVSIVGTGCLGPCVMGPAVLMGRDKVFYQNVQPADADRIVREHIIDGHTVDDLLYRENGTELPIPIQTDIQFFKRQTRVVLRNCGIIRPDNLNDYVARDGYGALAKTVTEMTPEEVIDEMKKSGLRGRGGAGFPTYLKWSFTRQSVGSQKYILCNADEGDPGAFMDRSVLEGDPHSVIEGMAIGAYAIGANQGYVYVRAEYPLAVERLQRAIDQAFEYGFLGKGLFGTDFSFGLEIRMGSGAFVCGEETALIASIEGKRGEPRPRPPFPAQRGLWDCPTVLNNVETFANVPPIMLHGGVWFAALGTEKSKGTKVFALAGAVNHAGIAEVPIGTTLGELIYDIGGGIKNGKKFKAAQIGGPSGGCIPRQHLNVPLDYESLTELGAIMGSGGLVVMDEDTCMVDVARFFLEFVQEESCGKCVPCRVGTKRMLEILNRICEGTGKEGDVERLIELGQQIRDTALCGLGQTAPNPVLSTIRHFRHEYDAHIREKQCEAGVCPGLVLAPCQSACPAHVDVPGFVSLVGEKRYAEALRLHRERNPFAAVCARVCFHTCEEKCRRSSLDTAVSIRGVKRFMVDQEVTLQVPEVKVSGDNARRKVAVIGAGPSGLSCAYFLARLGYRPVVFEAEHRPGGMLVQMIPAYRLPRETLAREIRMIENMGVDIRTGKRLGKDFFLTDLYAEGYEAVFLGVGTPDGINVSMKGDDVRGGIIQASDFLRVYSLRGSVKTGKKVVVIGGGNAAIDAARTAVRLGANVTVIYRRTRNEMPAYAEEIGHATEEGVEIQTLVNPEEVISKNGEVTGIRCIRMTLGEFDSSGRRRPEKTADAFTIDTDQIILACGQTIRADEIFDEHYEIESINNQKIKVNQMTGQTSVPWLFAGGDVATGPATVIEAVAGGERAAYGIDLFLTGSGHAFWRKEAILDTSFDPDAEPSQASRRGLPAMSVERRINNFDEVESPWVENEALQQAKRCLRCDYGRKERT